MDRRCFRDTFEAARNDDDPLLRTKRLLRSWLRSDRVVELKTSNDRFDANRYQGYATGVGQRRQYVVRAASMRMRLSRQPGGFRDAVLWLERQRLLQPRQSRTAGDRPVDWMERNVIWPTRSGDLQTRSIVFDEPFPEQGPSAGEGPTRSDAASDRPGGAARRRSSPRARSHNQ